MTYEIVQFIEPGVMRRWMPDGSVQDHKVGPETDVSGPGLTGGSASAGRVSREPPAWYREMLRAGRSR